MVSAMENNTKADPGWRAYSRPEAAAILGVSVKQVDAAIARGDLDHVRIGKHVRISDSALRRFAGQDPVAVPA